MRRRYEGLLICFIFFTSTISTAQNYEQTRDYRNTDHSLSTSYNQPANLYPLNKTNSGNGVWTELNPNLPRVEYLGIHFVNPDTGWAVGENGVIIYTRDGGVTWSIVNNTNNTLLLNVHSFNGQVVIATGFYGIILRSEDGGENWTEIPSGVGGDLWRVQMINDTLGWTCGLGPALLKTTDAGLTWNPVNTGYTSFQYWSLDFYNENVGYIAGGDGNVLKTTDGGNSWQHFDISAVNPYSLYAIDVVTPSRVVVGGFGRLAITTNGGNNWFSVGISDIVYTIAFADSLTGYEGQRNGEVWKTTDGGITWQINNWFPIYSKNWIMFINDSLGYIAGSRLNIQKTTDKGNLWTNCIINDDFKDVFFINETTGWISSAFKVYKTIDGGINWEKRSSPSGAYSLYFLNDLTGFAGDKNTGRIYKTIDGGNNWYLTNTSGIDGNISKIIFMDSTTGFATNGAILKTSDGGESWYIKLSVPFTSFRGISFSNDSTVWAVGGNTYPYEIYKSTDRGENWDSIITDIPNMKDVYFLNEQIGFIIATSELFKTTDGGESFQLDSTISGFGFAKFANFSSQSLFIVGSKAFITTNGGENWIEYPEVEGMGLIDLSLIDVNKGYSVGNTGIILKYFDENIPVELTSFLINTHGNDAYLNWSTASELNNRGFVIERSGDGVQFIKIAFVPGRGTTTNLSHYEYVDCNLTTGNYYYRLKQIDYNGSFSLSEIKSVKILSTQISLSQNYPNPANPGTIIRFSLPERSYVTLTLYSITGEELLKLINGYLEGGEHKAILGTKDLSSGVYFYRLSTSDGWSEIKKLVVIK